MTQFLLPWHASIKCWRRKISWKVNLFWLRCNITRTIKINVANLCIHTYALHVYTYMPWYIVWRTSYNWNSSLFNYILMTFSKGNGLIISNFNNFAFSIKLHTMVYTTIQLNGCNLIAHSMNISSINRFPFCRKILIILIIYILMVSKWVTS